MVGHVTAPAAAVLEQLPAWATLVRAANPGPMTLDGTNTWVLRAPGESHCVVVDPGPLDETHLQSVAGRGPVAAILLTHGHPDHRDGLARFQEITGAPYLATDRSTGEIVEGGLRLKVTPVPGHTADSVCFTVSAADHGGGADPGTAVLTGDTILGRGTTVVAWPDGDLGDYLASLRRLASLDGVPVLPGHGPALTDCGAAARFYLHHRLARLAQVRQVWNAGIREPAKVVAQVYADVDRTLWPAAEWSVRAQVAYLDQHPALDDLDRP